MLKAEAPSPELALDLPDDAVVVFDVSESGTARVVHVDSTYARWVGRSPESLRGCCPDFLGRPEAPGDPGLAQAVARGEAARTAVSLRHADGASRTMDLRLVPLSEPGATRRTFAALLRDPEPLARLVSQANVDALTGLLNRRAFMERATQAFAQSGGRRRQPLSVLLFDLDHFKQVNDSFGHAAGDTVLQRVAAACRKVVRGGDVLGRLGGEEFVILAPNTNLAGASTIGVRLCHAVRSSSPESEFPVGAGPVGRVRGQQWSEIGGTTPKGQGPDWAAEAAKRPESKESLDIPAVTVSVGVAERSVCDASFDQLLHRADAALYAAKDGGRDRVVLA